MDCRTWSAVAKN